MLNVSRSLSVIAVLVGLVGSGVAQKSGPAESVSAPRPGVHTASDKAHRFADLGTLMNDRLALMTVVAKYKWNTHAEIEDPVREQKILDGLKSQAEAAGLPSQWVQHFFREQIEAAKLVQYQMFAQWHREHRGAFPDTPDLATEVRPKLDALTPELLAAVKAHWSELAAGPVTVKSVGEMSVAQQSPRAVTVALLPLMDGSAEAQ